ncbi:hypothetical protein [Methanolobus profundi]|uniref:LexA-binding, inner membrane-associated hydrolase n=1 Tax=Methanolobus profundi TaxID=487685 RepID=A0A1I4T122_9EURY|nr:hypothetical protein [Methanolobus profundi]SFM70283.1 hypothetical protein SAMN04488696_2119 [Methanolobus profundi]
MPFTPFHFGPAFLLGEIFERKVNLFSILLGSVIIDVRATYCLFTGCRPLHGPLHNFLTATLIALLISWILFSQRNWLTRVTDKLRIEQTYSFISIIAGSIIGTWSHVFLDSFLYTDIIPFWPLSANPLLGMVGSGTIYTLCVISFLPAIVMFTYRYWKRA